MRKNITFILVGFVVLALCSTQAFASVYFITGNELYKNYLESKNDASTEYFLKGAYCGYVFGVTDSFDGVSYLIPDHVNGNQIFDIVGKYLEAHPERRHLAAYVLVIDALAGAFPKKE